MWFEVVRLAGPIGPVVALLAWALSRKPIRPDPFPAAARVWKALFVGCWVIGMTSIVALTALVYGHHSEEPDPGTGRTNSYNLHGTVIYLNSDEDGALHLFETVGFSSVLLGITSVFIMQRQQLRVDERKYTRQEPDGKS
jgi:hypothetical protein